MESVDVKTKAKEEAIDNAPQPSRTVRPAMKKSTKNMIFYCIMFTIPVLWFSYFYVGVNVNSIIMAFQKYDFSTGDYVWAGWLNFRNFFRQWADATAMLTMLKNSLYGFLCTLGIGMPLGLLFSFYIYKKKPGYAIFKVILFLPSIISAMVLAVMFKNFTESTLPPLMEKWFGLEMQGLLSNNDTQFGTILFYNVWIGFGSGILLYSGAMSRVPESIVESAQLDGISPVKEFFYITFPLIFGTVSTFIITGVAGLFTNQLNMYNLFSDGVNPASMTFGYYLFKGIAAASSTADYPYYAAIGLCLTIVAVPITWGVKFLCDKFGPENVEY